jgi:proteasome accessory factor C
MRLRRLLAILAYLAQVGEAPLPELAARFGIAEKALIAELELAACCGLPPYTPDQLLELVIDEDRVYAYGLEPLRRPPKLTPDEGFAVAAAARALLAVPGADPAGPLARALAKLEGALGDDHVRVELAIPDHLGTLRHAAAECALVEIDYLGANRGEETTRVVEPYSVVAREGHFYLDAFCHLAGDWRRFQVERIVAVRPTGAHGVPRIPPAELSGPRAFAGGPAARLAHLAVRPEALGPLERFATGPSELLEDGRLLIGIAVADEHWLGRLLLRLGGDAELLDPPELQGAAAKAAGRALARYRSER